MMPDRARFFPKASAALRRLKREGEREDLILTILAVAIAVFMLLTLGYAFAIFLANPPA